MSDARVVKLENTSRYQRLLNSDSGTRGIKAGHVVLKPGEDIGEHSTAKDIEEVLVILGGKGDLVIGAGLAKKIEIGHVAYVPPNTPHNVKNTGSGDLEYVFITSKC
ncbi:MAG: cupin domain-containing protein [Candidatus Omnitrophota bacterium]